jgi:signal transduction histidine kinase
MPDGGTLKIGTALAGTSVVITVSDTGYGISSKDLGKIFKPFFTTKVKGTGLGLAISKGIVDRHAGDLEIDSKAGEGTTAVITLPLTQDVFGPNNNSANSKLIEIGKAG